MFNGASEPVEFSILAAPGSEVEFGIWLLILSVPPRRISSIPEKGSLGDAKGVFTRARAILLTRS
jgi:hypothetical protein